MKKIFILLVIKSPPIEKLKRSDSFVSFFTAEFTVIQLLVSSPQTAVELVSSAPEGDFTY